ncbi:phytanoyl-CoA dioxygenase family protein [Saccharospirillum sp.]|uniref:phytanoyl-CoA dioxygenase family protein n=1 Tax=Saccharospirillum sp. TaxID=2033801 RepID=UPI0034A045C5
MSANNTEASVFADEQDTDIEAFARLCEQSADVRDYPRASTVERGVVIYDRLAFELDSALERRGLMAELNRVFSTGPGIVVVRGSFVDTTVLDRHTAVFKRIMADESEVRTAGDHFAAAGANTRVWNSVQKVAEVDPAAFIEYYANPVMHTLSEAWLGPHYQVTAQVNVVHPGGQAQQPHRDYHLGFQTNEAAARYPLAVHRLSPLLTLQGAVAHTDMPIESGPTQLLPFSHQYELGYLAWRQDAFKRYFAEHAVQLPLNKGDQLFFNPALFHAAGDNRTRDQHRMANLLQVSSVFGVPMETVDRTMMTLAIYPELLRQVQAGSLTGTELSGVIATVADGYSFPTNLDTDPPVNGLAPQTGQQVLAQALEEAWSLDRLRRVMADKASQRRASQLPPF